MPDPDDSGFAAAEREHLNEPEHRETEAEADRDDRICHERRDTEEQAQAWATKFLAEYEGREGRR